MTERKKLTILNIFVIAVLLYTLYLTQMAGSYGDPLAAAIGSVVFMVMLGIPSLIGCIFLGLIGLGSIGMFNVKEQPYWTISMVSVVLGLLAAWIIFLP